MKNNLDARPSPIAGQWYPGNEKQLSADVDGYINAATLPKIDGEIIAIIAPHAGYLYAGPVAGYAYAAIKGLAPDLVAVISPMHHPFYEPLLTSGHQVYKTPLGSVQINQEILQKLDTQVKAKLGLRINTVRKDPEHSLEIQLPFLQRAIRQDFSLVPVMVRDASVRVTQALGQSLAAVLKGKNALLVASTDLSHFYPKEMANKLDQEMLRRIEAFDPEAVLQAENEGVGFACGRGAVAAVLWAAKELGATQIKILNYATSGDVSGDYRQVVGYGAAIITR